MADSAQNISGGGAGGYGLIGGIIGSIHDGVFDWVNLGENRRIQRQNIENARSQIALQREFAQNSIQWRVADAKKAGIHPLAALGAQGTSYTPMDMSQWPVNYRTNRGMEMAAYFSNLETQKLQNELLTTQIETQRLENTARQKELDTPAGQSSATILLPSKKNSPTLNKQGVKDNGNPVPQAQFTAKPNHPDIPLIMRIEPSADESDKIESLGILNKINYWKDYHWNGESVAMARQDDFLKQVSNFFKENPHLAIEDYDVVLRGDRLRGFQWQLERKPKKTQRTFVPKSGKGG